MSTKEMLFKILKWQIGGKMPDDMPSELDVNEQIQLYKLSVSHDLAHIVSNGLSQLALTLDEKVAAAFKKQQMIAVFRYEKIKKDLSDVCSALDSASIEYTPLKGSVIRGYYPAPWMRTSCDIDVLVSNEDLEAARSMLVEKLGFEDKGKSSHDVQMITPAQTHIELHYSLTESHDLDSSSEILEDYKKYCVKTEGSRLDFCDEFFYYFHIDHMAKHFQYGGCGIKPFMDLWVLENRVEHDRAKRDALLQKGGMLTFANAAKELMGVWFDQKEHTELTRIMEEYILNGGVYGTLDNYVAMNQPRQGGKFKYALSRIFISYDQIKYIYPILEKHKWLFPFMQLRRWCRLVFCGHLKKSLGELHTNATMDENTIDKTRYMLDKLGLVEKKDK